MTERAPHEGQHQGCDVCFVIKCRSISFTSAAMPNRKAATRAKNAQEHDLDKNLSAFKRLRQSGVMPASTAQAANLERYSDTQHEIESGRRFGNAKVAKEVEKRLSDIPPPPLPAGMVAK